MFGFMRKLFGTKHERTLKKLQPLVTAINDLEPSVADLSDQELAAKTPVFRTRCENGESLDDLLPEVFATVREAGKRVLNMRHYDVQLVGGIVLFQGDITEMKTGEGKTLVATLPLVLNAMAGQGGHLVTVNDYLATRDAEWMGRLYNFLGMSVGTIRNQMPDAERRAAYHSDITYGTNNEYGFDYLRDNMKFQIKQRVQRGLNYAIVDEVDSILIDEARTPLIISGQGDTSTDLYHEINKVVPSLRRDEDYIVDEAHHSVTLTDEGVEKVERKLNLENLFEPTNIEYFHHVNKALQAHTLYKRDVKYMVKDDEVVIIDDFTGRLMPGRRWSDGLHQAVEAKEGVKIKNENKTLATVTFQNFFRMYDKLAGMTGTADTAAEEFHKTYKLDVVVIPTNRPCVRKDHPDVVYKTERAKFTAIVDQILVCHKKGQPVLVGTVSVEKSEAISRVLKKFKIPHNVLNAKHHEHEAEIVAQAGRKGGVTIATNMAGRGTDIILGGNFEALAKTRSPDEESDEYRKALEHFLDSCGKDRETVLEAGGMFILGTERHEARRIDLQLRGRSGRQGDPGESRFFLSLDDDLMRRFGAERIAAIMNRLGMEEDVPIEHRLVTRSIASAQSRVEGMNFDIRKNLLEYDDVMDKQRKAIYELRDAILLSVEQAKASDNGEPEPEPEPEEPKELTDDEDDEVREEPADFSELMLDLYEDALVDLLDQYTHVDAESSTWELGGLQRQLKSMFALELDLDDPQFKLSRDQLEEKLWAHVEQTYRDKQQEFEYIAERINERYSEEADFNPKTGGEILQQQERFHYLREIDKLWREHLTAMQTLRDSVSLHGYAQRDPKQEYKKTGFSMFEELLANVRHNVSQFVYNLKVKKDESVTQTQHRGPVRMALGRGKLAGQQTGRSKPMTFRRQQPRVGRNEPCPCGSGKKYKKCCMANDQDEAVA